MDFLLHLTVAGLFRKSVLLRESLQKARKGKIIWHIW